MTGPRKDVDLGRGIVRERIRERLFVGLEPKETTVGRFVLREKLGEGAMGAVYCAYDPRLKREVALKFVRGEALTKATFDTAALLREAQALARLSHPNVVTVHEVGEQDGGLFIAMERVDGQTLTEWLEAGRPVSERLKLLIAAGRGLAAAHGRGLIHRDFKPDNVMVGRDGRPRVVDFGLVRVGRTPEEATSSPAHRRVQATSRAGTPRYMSSEQLRGEACDALSDQFNFCATVFEAVFDRPPFLGTTPTAQLESIRRGVALPSKRHAAAALFPVLQRGLAANANDRFPTMNALLTTLEETSTARPSWGKRWGLWGAALAVSTLMAALVGWATMKRKSPAKANSAPTAKLGVDQPRLYAELTQLTQRGEFQKCIDVSKTGSATPHVLNVRLACAKQLGDDAQVAEVCAAFATDFPRQGKPYACSAAYIHVKALYDQGDHRGCIEAGLTSPPDTMMVILLYDCAGELRDRNVYAKVCQYAARHFPKLYPIANCPTPLP